MKKQSKLYMIYKNHEKEFIAAIKKAILISSNNMGKDANKIYSIKNGRK